MPFSEQQEKILGIAALLALAVGCLWVIWPFLTAILWAAVLCWSPRSFPTSPSATKKELVSAHGPPKGRGYRGRDRFETVNGFVPAFRSCKEFRP